MEEAAAHPQGFKVVGLDARDITQWVHRERDLRNYEQRAGEFCQIMKACDDLHIPKVKCRLGAMISKSDITASYGPRPLFSNFGKVDLGSATLSRRDTVLAQNPTH